MYGHGEHVMRMMTTKMMMAMNLTITMKRGNMYSVGLKGPAAVDSKRISPKGFMLQPRQQWFN